MISQELCVKILAAELFKIKNNLSKDIMAQLICKRNSVGHRFVRTT